MPLHRDVASILTRAEFDRPWRAVGVPRIPSAVEDRGALARERTRRSTVGRRTWLFACILAATLLAGSWVLAGEPSGTPSTGPGAPSSTLEERAHPPGWEGVDLDPLRDLDLRPVSRPGPVCDDLLCHDIEYYVDVCNVDRPEGCDGMRVVYVEVTHVGQSAATTRSGTVAAIVERWFVDNCGVLAAYRVVLSPHGATGATLIQVQPDASPDTSFRGFLASGAVAGGRVAGEAHRSYAIDVPACARRLRLYLESDRDLVLLATDEPPRPCWTGMVPWDHALRARDGRANVVVEAPTPGFHYVFVIGTGDATTAASFRLSASITFDADCR